MISSNALGSPSTTSAHAIWGFAPGPALASAVMSGSLAGSAIGEPYSVSAVPAIAWIGSEGRASALIARFTPSGSLAKASCFSASCTSSSLRSLAAHSRHLGICSALGRTKIAFFCSSACSTVSLSASCLRPMNKNSAAPMTATSPTKITKGLKRPFLKLPSPMSKEPAPPPPAGGAAGAPPSSSSGGHFAASTRSSSPFLILLLGLGREHLGKHGSGSRVRRLRRGVEHVASGAGLAAPGCRGSGPRLARPRP